MSLIRRTNSLFPSFFNEFGKDLFDDFSSLDNSKSLLAVNVIEEKDEYKIEVAAPGFQKEDFKVNMEGNVLTISAEKKTDHEEKKEKYTQREFTYSSFSRSFTLPEGAEVEHIAASCKDGILSINIPKKEEAKKKEPKQIAIA